MASANNANVMA